MWLLQAFNKGFARAGNPPRQISHSPTLSSSREGNHFDIWEHAVFDVDRRDVACVIGDDEKDAAAVPEVLAVFLAGFDVQFQSLSSHSLILTLSVSMNMSKAGTKGMSAGKWSREGCAWSKL
jgi:hypothetical protein